MTQNEKTKYIDDCEEYGRTLSQRIIKESGRFQKVIFEDNPTTSRTDYDFTAYTHSNMGFFNVEVKVRSIDHDRYDTVICKTDKLDAMIEKGNREIKIPWFVNIYTDGKMGIWQIDKDMLAKCEVRTLYTRDVEGDENSPKRPHTYYYLPLKYAEWMDYDA